MRLTGGPLNLPCKHDVFGSRFQVFSQHFKLENSTDRQNVFTVLSSLKHCYSSPPPTTHTVVPHCLIATNGYKSIASASLGWGMPSVLPHSPYFIILISFLYPTIITHLHVLLGSCMHFGFKS